MTKRKTKHRLWLMLVVLVASGVLWAEFAGSPGYAQEGGDFGIIVNASNPVDEMSKKQLGRIFLKKQEEWPNGFGITVVDQRSDAAVRLVFSRAILDKDPPAVEAYWSKLIFSGMGIPPIKLASNAEVIEFVGNNVGSIGYVSAGIKLDANVKELKVTP